jgi:hypothetical protein
MVKSTQNSAAGWSAMPAVTIAAVFAAPSKGLAVLAVVVLIVFHAKFVVNV